MQGLNSRPASAHVIARTSCWPYFALGLALSACQPRQAVAAMPPPPVAAMAPSPLGATPSTAELSTPLDAAPPAGQYAPASTTENTDSARILDDVDDAHRLDNSYNRANLRPQYRQCVAASGSDISALHACMDEEFQWQDERLRSAWGAIANGPDSSFKDRLADEQHIYMSDTYKKCHYDPITKDKNQLFAAQPCLTNRHTNRADALEALITK